MYQYRYLVCIWLMLYAQHMFTQDQLGQNAGGASFASQTPVADNEVKPLVDPLAGGSPDTVAAPDPSKSAALPWTPTPDAPPALPAEQAAPVMQPVPTGPVSAPISQPAPVAQVATPVVPTQTRGGASAASANQAPTVATVPQAPTPSTPQEQEDKIIEPKGIDTVDIKEPEGNWLFKRIWWEKSKEIYGKIRERVDKIVESRMHFFKERVKLDRDVLDPFYVEIGLDQGTLKESVAHLLGLLEKEHEAGSLSVAGEEKYAALREEKAAITKLGESVTSVQELDKKLDEALEKLMNQINLARSYESEAWQLLDQIAEELSDKKAREHYYAIATLWRNVKEIGNYIQGSFAQHFIQLAQASVKSVQNIKTIADLLEKKGFDLKQRVELNKKEDENQVEEEDEDIWPKKELGWGAWLWKKITDWFIG